MNFGALGLKAVVIIGILFLLYLAGAVTFPALAIVSNSSGVAITSILLLILAIFILSVIGNLLGRGIRSVKKPIEALILAFVGSFFMGAALALFAVLNVPYTARINLAWLGTNWYSPFLALLFIGAPLMLVFMVAE
ncbi:MAG: hypothetical protein NVS2B12_25130 [Ktedonobacteraceae bacterium]